MQKPDFAVQIYIQAQCLLSLFYRSPQKYRTEIFIFCKYIG